MIVIKITGGLGNQLFQYATGRAISMRLGCELVLDTSFYPTQTLRKYELDKFNIKARIASEQEIKKSGGGSDIFSRLVRKAGLTNLLYPNYIREIESIKYVEAVDSCKSGAYLDGYWQNPSYFSDIKPVLCDEFKPVAPISDEASGWLEKINAVESVSLHVRRGDYVNNAHTNSVHGTCSLDYYKSAITEISSKVENPIFFVFSDDIEWCKSNLGTLGDFKYVDNTKSAIDDLVLMSQCRHNIIANSTFSWWGAWLASESEVIAPKKWFIDDSRNNFEIFPLLWVLL